MKTKLTPTVREINHTITASMVTTHKKPQDVFGEKRHTGKRAYTHSDQNYHEDKPASRLIKGISKIKLMPKLTSFSQFHVIAKYKQTTSASESTLCRHENSHFIHKRTAMLQLETFI